MNKKIGKILCMLVAAAMLMTVVLTGCGSNGEGTAKDTATQTVSTQSASTSESTTEPKKPVTITVTSFRAEDEAIYNQLIDKFQMENPWITVDLQLVKDANAYYQTLKANLLSSEGVDVFDIHPNVDFVNYVKEGQVLDLSNEPFIADYSDGAKTLTTIDGKIWGFNPNLNLIVVFYNKEIFTKDGVDVPTDWNSFVAACKKLSDAGEGGMSYLGADVKSVWMFMDVMLAEAGTEGYKKFFEDLDSGNLINIKDNPAAYAAVKTMAEINKNKILYNGAETLGYAPSVTLFAQKKAPMLMMGTWSFGTADNDFPGIDYGVFPLPTLNKPNISCGIPGTISCIASKSKNVEGSKAWINFFAKPENAAIYSNGTKMLSTVKGVKAEFAGADILADLLSKGVSVLPVVVEKNTTVTYQILYTQLLENILFKGADVEQEIEKAADALTKADLKNKQ